MSIDLLKYTAELTGTVNGERIALSGNGVITPDGITSGDYMIFSLPKQFDPRLLCAVLITGYPNACAPEGDIENVFKGISYTYSRDINFHSGAHLRLEAKCTLSNNILNSFFDLSGGGVFPTARGIRPIIESWAIQPPNMVLGSFVVAWTQEDESLSIADSYTTYHLSASITEDDFLYRHIFIDASISDSLLSLSQKSLLNRLMHTSVAS